MRLGMRGRDAARKLTLKVNILQCFTVDSSKIQFITTRNQMDRTKVQRVGWTCKRCEQNTLTRHIFSCFSSLTIMSHTTLAQGVSARHIIHVSCACVSDLSSTLHFALFTVSLIFYFILLIFSSSSMWVGSERNSLCASANEESGPLANKALLTKEDLHIISLQRKRKIPRTMVSYSEQTRQQWAYETSMMAFIFKHIMVGQVWMELEVSS